MAELDFESGRERLWRDLQRADPGQVQSRTGAALAAGVYSLPFLGRHYRVDSAARRLEGQAADPLAADAEFELLILIYLLRCSDIEASGRWVSEKDLPGGSNFFRGPHRLPTDSLSRRYGRNVEAFRRDSLALGGSSLEFGDASYAFRPLAGIPLACVLHGEDEEFPAQVNLLFDSTIEFQLPLDIILALGHSFAVILESQAS